jgi:exonuclease III
VLCLQEIKANDFRLQQALRTILPDYNTVVAPPEGTRGGTAIMVHPEFSIQGKGSLNFGQAAWVQLTAQGEDFGIVSIYASSESAWERNLLWHILTNQLAADRWILCGDFNMVETQEDTTGTASILHGREQDSWRILQNRFEMEDTHGLAHTCTGSRFTQRGQHFQKFIQSRLDIIYVSDGGWWIDAIHWLGHVPDCALSDHDPVILHITLNKLLTGAGARRTLHFKANPAVIRRPGVLELLETAWKAHTSPDLDPRVQFTLASEWLWEKYKELQESVKNLDEVIKLLKADVPRLKLELKEGDIQTDIQELLAKTS